MWVAHAPGMFSPPPNSKETTSSRSRHASRHVHYAHAVMHVGIANPQWRGKHSRHSRRMRYSQFHVSGKRLMYHSILLKVTGEAYMYAHLAGNLTWNITLRTVRPRGLKARLRKILFSHNMSMYLMCGICTNVMLHGMFLTYLTVEQESVRDIVPQVGTLDCHTKHYFLILAPPSSLMKRS